MRYIAVFITCANRKEAEKIAKALVKEKLAACGSIMNGISSTYWWKGKIEEAKETLLIAKTTKPMLVRIIKRVKELHSYDVPEIIALSIIGGSKDYHNWILKSVNSR